MVKKSYKDSDLLCLLDVTEGEVEEHFNNTDVPILTNVTTEYGTYIEIPDAFNSVESRVQFAIISAEQRELIENGDEVFVVLKPPEFEEGEITVNLEYSEEDISASLDELFINSAPDVDTIKETLRIAISLARTGQKGSPVGALFVVGDSETVMNKSSKLNFNPFSSENVHINDEVVSAALGEFSKLDGAFVIDNSGYIVSANRYLEPSAEDAESPSGLGARHMVASGITASTDAVSIVVSETDQKVRCFANGRLVLKLEPEDFGRTIIY